jgi:V/A-type H+-transporting ATPase subunit F
MQFYLICNDVDTLIGMRFAGIDGNIAQTVEDVKYLLEKAINTANIAIVMITKPLVDLCRNFIYKLKFSSKKILIIEIPSGENFLETKSSFKNSIIEYVKQSIGIKMNANFDNTLQIKKNFNSFKDEKNF